jgi:predicted DNA binding CopG/RHH family protein
MKKIKLDKYEQSIEDNIQNFVPVSKKERAKIEAIIASANKNKNINIRISSHDIDRIRQLSAAEGLHYQTFISSIIHKYVAGKLIDESAFLKSMQLLGMEPPPTKNQNKPPKSKKSA